MRKILTKDILIKFTIFILLAVLILICIFNWDKITVIVYPFIISLFIAYLINPLICSMEHCGIKRSTSILIVYVILLLVALFICFYVIPEIIRDTGTLIDVLPKYNMRLMNMVQYFQDKYTKSGLPDGIKNVIDNNINKIQDYMISYLESIISLILNYLSKIFSIILIPFLSYYFLKDYKKIGTITRLLIPRKYRNQIIRIITNIDIIFGEYVRSQIILSAIVGVLTFIALLGLKVNFALLFGILNGVTNIIPYFGPLIGALPAVFIALLQSPSKALWVMLLIFIIQQIESNILSPKITGNSVDLHPSTVILALVIGGEFFGAPGMILGVPAAAAIKIIYRDIMKNLF